MLFSDKGIHSLHNARGIHSDAEGASNAEKKSLLAVPERHWATPGYDFPPGEPQKEVKVPRKNSFDLCSFLGFNAGSLLRIPRAQLLSGTERLGSRRERKGDRECWGVGRR